jgi:hypothetical protein
MDGAVRHDVVNLAARNADVLKLIGVRFVAPEGPSRDFDHRATHGGHYSALTKTSRSTNVKRQRDDDKKGATSMLCDEGAVYYPDELSLLGQVLDQVVQSLPPNLRTPDNRTAIAKNILLCASKGERDPNELRRAALTSSNVPAAA